MQSASGTRHARLVRSRRAGVLQPLCAACSLRALGMARTEGDRHTTYSPSATERASNSRRPAALCNPLYADARDGQAKAERGRRTTSSSRSGVTGMDAATLPSCPLPADTERRENRVQAALNGRTMCDRDARAAAEAAVIRHCPLPAGAGQEQAARDNAITSLSQRARRCVFPAVRTRLH